jgi:hypothetical protein
MRMPPRVKTVHLNPLAVKIAELASVNYFSIAPGHAEGSPEICRIPGTKARWISLEIIQVDNDPSLTLGISEVRPAKSPFSAIGIPRPAASGLLEKDYPSVTISGLLPYSRAHPI